jgi:hypothetical protein
MTVPILIGGAASATGSVATKLLLQMGFPVRAIVRGDDGRAHTGQFMFEVRLNRPVRSIVDRSQFRDMGPLCKRGIDGRRITMMPCQCNVSESTGPNNQCVRAYCVYCRQRIDIDDNPLYGIDCLLGAFGHHESNQLPSGANAFRESRRGR